MRMISLLSLVALCSCEYSVQRSTTDSPPSVLPGYQLEKQKITDDCYERRSTFNEIYRLRWADGRVARESDSGEAGTVVWLTIAGCLMETDPSHYEDYYSYIAPKLNDDTEYVAAAAVTAMRAARGNISIDKVAEMIDDQRSLVSGNAVLALDYIIKGAMYDSSREQDLTYATEKMKKACILREVQNLDRICGEIGLSK